MFRHNLQPLSTPKSFMEFIVLDINPVEPPPVMQNPRTVVRGKRGKSKRTEETQSGPRVGVGGLSRKHSLAEVEVVRAKDFGTRFYNLFYFILCRLSQSSV